MIDSSAHSGTSTSRTLGLFIGFVFLIFNLWTYRQAYLLKHEGMPIQGTVTEAHMVRRRGSVSYSAEYRYDLSGKSYTGTADMNRAMYLALRLEGPLPCAMCRPRLTFLRPGTWLIRTRPFF